jgi:hypothetical protein
MGLPKRGDSQGSRAVIVIKCLGQCPGQGEGPQGDESVHDCAMDVVNRKGISSQGKLPPKPGEPDALKGACPVCAVRRVMISLLEAGGIKEIFLGYRHTWRRKSKGTKHAG